MRFLALLIACLVAALPATAQHCDGAEPPPQGEKPST